MTGRRQVDDGKPPMLQTDPRGAVRRDEVLSAAIIGSAMKELEHALFISGRVSDRAKDSTHVLSALPSLPGLDVCGLFSGHCSLDMAWRPRSFFVLRV